MASVSALTYSKTTVFWDAEDFPIPADWSLEKIIKKAIEKEGYRGEVFIRSYGEKKPENMNKSVPKGEKFWRLNEMLLDIGWWETDNPKPRLKPANLMVIAKDMEKGTQFSGFLIGLSSLGYKVLLVLPSDCDAIKVKVPFVKNIWYWERLLSGDKPLHHSVISRLMRAFYKDAPLVAFSQK